MKMWFKFSLACAAVIVILTLGACGKKEEATAKPQTPSVPITVTEAEATRLPYVQESIGWLESKNAPVVSAEVGGRILEIRADAGSRVTAGQILAVIDPADFLLAKKAASAEVARLNALIANQQALVDRYAKLVGENFISSVTMEGAASQLDALREQMEAARAQLASAGRGLEKTRIVAPISGQVEQRMISVGSFVDIGKPAFQIASSAELRVFLPFPETVSGQIKTGLKAVISTPSAPDKPMQGVVSEIRPMVGTGNRAIVAIVDVRNPGGWKPGASVAGSVVISEMESAVMLPTGCFVKRPAGDVVYVIENGEARQRVVKMGRRMRDKTHVAEGLSAGETVALDGAAYLTDKAKVAVKQAAGAQTGPKKGA